MQTGVYVDNLREECVFTMKDVTQLLIKVWFQFPSAMKKYECLWSKILSMLFRLLHMVYWDKHAVISTALTQLIRSSQILIGA